MRSGERRRFSRSSVISGGMRVPWASSSRNADTLPSRSRILRWSPVISPTAWLSRYRSNSATDPVRRSGTTSSPPCLRHQSCKVRPSRRFPSSTASPAGSSSTQMHHTEGGTVIACQSAAGAISPSRRTDWPVPSAAASSSRTGRPGSRARNRCSLLITTAVGAPSYSRVSRGVGTWMFMHSLSR